MTKESTMDPKATAEPKARLAALIEQVIADGRVDPDERQQLLRFFAQEALSVSDVQDVFKRFLVSLENQVLADGLVSEEETRRCKAVVDQLRIPLRFLSPRLLAIVLGKTQPPG